MNFKEFKGQRQRSFLGYFVVGLIGALIGGISVAILVPGIYTIPNTSKVEQQVKESKTVEKVNINTDISSAAALVSPSVVGVVTTKLEKSLFNQNETQGVGSGVILSEKGYILTNNHVADMNASSITVMTHDGNEHKAKAIWADLSLDLSVIKIEAEDLKSVKMGDSKSLTVGEPAIAIGNPLGLTFQRSVTAGIISAVNRTLEIEKGVFMEDLIQTDASINPGNSGGPLVNIKGEVIGINTAKVSTAEGIGFSVPINIIKPVIESIESTGEFNAPYIGVLGLDREVSGYYGYDIQGGIYIVKVDKGSPASDAGLTTGDIILKIDGENVDTVTEFKEKLFLKKEGETMKLNIKSRLGGNKDIKLKVSLR